MSSISKAIWNYEQLIVLIGLAEYGKASEDYIKKELHTYSYRRLKRSLLRDRYCFETPGGCVLTSKGKRLLQKNADYVWFFHCASPYVSLKEFVNCRAQENQDKDFDDIMVPLLEEKAVQALKEGAYVTAQNLYYEAGEINEVANTNSGALARYLIALAIATNRTGEVLVKNAPDQIPSRYLPYELCRKIWLLKDYYEPLMTEVAKKHLAQLNIACDAEALSAVLDDIFQGDYDPIESASAPVEVPVVIGGLSKNNKPTLTWNEIPGAEKYEVYRATGETGKFTCFFSTMKTTYTNLSSVTSGATYYFKVRAVDEDGNESDFSPAVKVQVN